MKYVLTAGAAIVASLTVAFLVYSYAVWGFDWILHVPDWSIGGRVALLLFSGLWSCWVTFVAILVRFA